MEQFLAYSIVGLSTAVISAIIGSGLVLTYTTTGVFTSPTARRACWRRSRTGSSPSAGG